MTQRSHYEIGEDVTGVVGKGDKKQRYNGKLKAFVGSSRCLSEYRAIVLVEIEVMGQVQLREMEVPFLSLGK